MWTVVAAIAIAIIVLIVVEDYWILYSTGYAVAAVGVLILFWVALQDRFRARKIDDLDDVGFN
jgi:hypothetical protein